MKKQICEPPKIDFNAKNIEIKNNLVKVYAVALTICIVFVAVKGFI